jgi:hypothetical protein
MPEGRIIICQTRWHDDDLAGQILSSEDGERWTVLSLPAIAEDNDALGRLPGEALWPSRFPIEAMPSVERSEISSSPFASLYQQNPVPAGGAILRRHGSSIGTMSCHGIAWRRGRHARKRLVKRQ